MAGNGQSRTARRKQKNSKKKPIWRRIFLLALIAILVIGIGVAALFSYYIATAPEIDASKLKSPFPSKIYDRDGELIADLGNKARTKVEYEDLPDVLIDAVTATEDSRFFEHPGIDIWRIGGAVIGNITNGFGSQGASTITQQLVEKSFLSHEKKISIKVQEMWLALQLEQEYSKKQILEMYLNKIYYGSGAYGVGKAAEVYFGKSDLSKLTLPEAAILAGLPQRPSAYNPYENPKLMKERMKTVLYLMVQHDRITKEQAEKAGNVDIKSLLSKKEEKNNKYLAFLDRVRKEVKNKVDGADIYTDGLKIYTTIDTDIQEHVQFLLSESENNPIDYPGPITDSEGNQAKMKAGMVVLDTQSGAIRAIGGGRNYKHGLNYATDISRQPGSTFKPIIAYGPAIESKQWSTYHQLNDDGPFEIKGTDQEIHTWVNGGHYYDWVSMRFALRESLNVPAVKTLTEVGYDTAQKFAENLGIEFADDKLTLTDAIGGSATGTNPMELAGAYRAFANGGIYNEPYAVTKVEFPDTGKTVNLKPEPEAVMSDYTAYMITDMLKTAITEGTGKLADIPGMPVAGKTGTTNLEGVDGSPDSWFTGYTTNYTISAWTGYNNQKLVLPNTKIPHALFKNTMTEISKDMETPDFEKPDSVVEVGVEEGSRPAKLPSAYTPSSEIVKELFVKGHEPTSTSEKFDQLDPVSNLKGTYDKDANSIKVSWDYSSDDNVSFDIRASVNGGSMQSLSSTDDQSLEISNVEPGASYQIQVIAISDDSQVDSSSPETVTVKVPGENENKEDEENGNEPMKVTGVNASFNPDNKKVTMSWDYSGPPATYNVVIQGISSQEVSSTNASYSLEFPHPGKTYTVSVVPIGKKGSNQGQQGTPGTTQFTVPADFGADEGGDDGTGGPGEDDENGGPGGDNGAGNGENGPPGNGDENGPEDNGNSDE
ncbi:PBP1A family penicillin-binding protein [Virgibacillus siamensis]|uniref:PBP1A family penicillin-binding protein n=1 Tax=Virgibacillus siamensis TaxID=480071 RepID=UPI000986E52E|nr:PBP1A family penicillin-binding protein [Virgibacillus siamensis]